MEGVKIMIGKTLKVVEYNLSFGSNARLVNVFSCFKYKKTNSLYLLYTDVDTKYNIIYFGSSHVKETSILSMECKSKDDEEIIKEYIYKLTNNEDTEEFIPLSLDKIEEIEIISSSKLEVKPEVISKLTELTIPKKEVPQEKQKPTKKKSSKKMLLVLLVLFTLAFVAYLYLTTLQNKDTTEKSIVCVKHQKLDELDANLEEKITYNFDRRDNLITIDTNKVYSFLSEEAYQDFIIKGTIYKYMPAAEVDGGYSQNDEELNFKVITKEKVDSSYNKPTNYEEVFTVNKQEGYACSENVEKD